MVWLALTKWYVKLKLIMGNRTIKVRRESCVRVRIRGRPTEVDQFDVAGGFPC